MYELMVENKFDSAHYLENYDGPCSRMHGHTYKVQVTICGEKLDEKVGMLLDFTHIKKHLNKIVDRLDHQVLNEILDCNTTAELLSKYFYDELEKKVPDHCKLKKVCIWETPTSSATYYKT